MTGTELLLTALRVYCTAGIRTPLPVAHMAETFPEAHADLVHNTQILEKHMRDMQDCE